MKLLSVFFFAVLLLPDPSKVSKINKLKDEAKKAYLANDMKTAIEKYRYLIDSLHVNEEEVNMNLANAYFSQNDTTNAVNNYQPLTASANPKIKTLANQQMGVVANRQGKFEEALNYFKQAMKAEPNNEQARYNYEMVKKKLEEQKKQQQQNKDQNNKDNKDKKDDQKKDQQNKDNKDQQNKDNKDQKDKQDQNKDQKDKDKQDQQKKDQQNKDDKNKDKKDQNQKDKEQKDKNQKDKEKQEQQDQKDQKKDEQKPDPSVQQKLEEMKMSEDKAKMILEAMKNQEAQYLQQNKRKASKPQNKNKPDW